MDAGFGGLRVAAFESRRAAEMQRLIERHGGEPHVSPSLREVPVEAPAAVATFVEQLLGGKLQVLILLTGVGTRRLLEEAELFAPRERLLEALADVVLIARGPKPLAVLAEVNLKPRWKVPEPNTWQEVLEIVEEHLDVSGLQVAVQEYGRPQDELLARLRELGAQVLPLRVYRYDLPVDTGPLTANLRAWAAGELDLVLFTSAHQVVNTVRHAGSLNLLEQLAPRLARMLVASIGPVTSEALREQGFEVDLEPEHARMGQLVAQAASRAAGLLARKRGSSGDGENARGRNGEISNPTENRSACGGTTDNSSASRHPSHNSLFLRACRREPVDRTPIWLMRQAGRYMAEYRAVRSQGSFLDLCKDPPRCAEVMLTAVERLGVDAAIIFSDLLPILEPLGLELDFTPGEGPLIYNPVRSAAAIDALRELSDLGELQFVLETVRLTRDGLPSELPLIGFAGAPFTLASYAIEGGSSRSFLHTKSLMYTDPGAWHALLAKLARAITVYLNGQIAAGAQAVQIFDSWVGRLGPDDYRRYVLPHSQTVISGLPKDVPVIHFATGNPALLPLVTEAGGTVIGLDWRVRLDEGWRTVGFDRAVQGNLDPLVLLAEPAEIRRRAAEVLAQAGGRPGHIFNLGHGVLPQTPVENAIALVQAVGELSESVGGRQ